MQAHTLAPQLLPCGSHSSVVSGWTRFWHALVWRRASPGVETFSVRLYAGQELQFCNAVGWTVVCRGGVVWITQEADARDTFLEQGEGFALDRSGLALVRACRDTLLSIRAPAGSGALQGAARRAEIPSLAPDERADLAWLRSLYPDCGPWNDPASYRRAGLL